MTNLPRPNRTGDKVAFTDGQITRTGEILAMESWRYTLLHEPGGPLWLEVGIQSGMAVWFRLLELNPDVPPGDTTLIEAIVWRIERAPYKTEASDVPGVRRMCDPKARIIWRP